MSSTRKFFLFKMVYDCDLYFLSGGCLEFSFICERLYISHELQVGKFMSYQCTDASEHRCFSVEVFVRHICIFFIHSYMNTHVKYHCVWICRVALNVFQGQFLDHVLV